MPKIYGNDKAGRIHREAQPAPGPERERREPWDGKIRVAPPRWRRVAVTVGGVDFPCAAEADRAMGWRTGATAEAIRKGRKEVAGVPVARRREGGGHA